ncbi:MAG: hypothetical protein J0L72_02290 [Armatimonadetes bacterium]|nr:hypothetical protein [Armatimonadota bacterium]
MKPSKLFAYTYVHKDQPMFGQAFGIFIPGFYNGTGWLSCLWLNLSEVPPPPEGGQLLGLAHPYPKETVTSMFYFRQIDFKDPAEYESELKKAEEFIERENLQFVDPGDEWESKGYLIVNFWLDVQSCSTFADPELCDGPYFKCHSEADRCRILCEMYDPCDAPCYVLEVFAPTR